MARTKDFDENEVLKKAVSIFWLKGYNGTSMQDLVEGLGISRSSLYDTFGDKYTLFVKALELYQYEASQKVCNVLRSDQPARCALRNLLELLTGELLDDQKHKGCFLVNAEVEVAPHDAQIGNIICQNDQQLEDAICLVIQKGQDKGEINTERDARALARFIFNTIKGIRVTAKSTNDRSVFNDIVQMALKLLD